MRSILVAFTISFALYLLVLGLVYAFQRHFLYIPDHNVPSDQYLADAQFSVVKVRTVSGLELSSLWRPPSDKAARPVIIHFHGNGGSAYQRTPLYSAMAADGAGVLAVGYPGYGGNPGSPSEEEFYRAALAHYNWLIKQGVKPDHIVIVGQSLGTGVATWLASEKEAAGLILEAAYTGMDDMAQRQFPFLPARYLVKDAYPSMKRIGAIDMPLVWIHGTQDEIIPFAMGRRLFDAAQEPKTAFPIKQGRHNDLWSRGIDGLIRDQAERFVSGG